MFWYLGFRLLVVAFMELEWLEMAALAGTLERNRDLMNTSGSMNIFMGVLKYSNVARMAVLGCFEG